MSKSDRMYKDSPSLKRGDDGDMGISRPSDADAENMGISGDPVEGTPGEMPVDVNQSTERHEVHHKHVTEHLAVHKRHESEHATHKGDKKELHKKHESEIKEMHDRHHAELKSMHKRHEMNTAPRDTSKEEKE